MFNCLLPGWLRRTVAVQGSQRSWALVRWRHCLLGCKMRPSPAAWSVCERTSIRSMDNAADATFYQRRRGGTPTPRIWNTARLRQRLSRPSLKRLLKRQMTINTIFDMKILSNHADRIHCDGQKQLYSYQPLKRSWIYFKTVVWPQQTILAIPTKTGQLSRSSWGYFLKEKNCDTHTNSYIYYIVHNIYVKLYIYIYLHNIQWEIFVEWIFSRSHWLMNNIFVETYVTPK